MGVSWTCTAAGGGLEGGGDAGLAMSKGNGGGDATAGMLQAGTSGGQKQPALEMTHVLQHGIK